MSGVSTLADKGAKKAENAQNTEENLMSSEAMRIP